MSSSETPTPAMPKGFEHAFDPDARKAAEQKLHEAQDWDAYFRGEGGLEDGPHMGGMGTSAASEYPTAGYAPVNQLISEQADALEAAKASGRELDDPGVAQHRGKSIRTLAKDYRKARKAGDLTMADDVMEALADHLVDSANRSAQRGNEHADDLLMNSLNSINEGVAKTQKRKGFKGLNLSDKEMTTMLDKITAAQERAEHAEIRAEIVEAEIPATPEEQRMLDEATARSEASASPADPESVTHEPQPSTPARKLYELLDEIQGSDSGGLEKEFAVAEAEDILADAENGLSDEDRAVLQDMLDGAVRQLRESPDADDERAGVPAELREPLFDDVMDESDDSSDRGLDLTWRVDDSAGEPEPALVSGDLTDDDLDPEQPITWADRGDDDEWEVPSFLRDPVPAGDSLADSLATARQGVPGSYYDGEATLHHEEAPVELGPETRPVDPADDPELPVELRDRLRGARPGAAPDVEPTPAAPQPAATPAPAERQPAVNEEKKGGRFRKLGRAAAAYLGITAAKDPSLAARPEARPEGGGPRRPASSRPEAIDTTATAAEPTPAAPQPAATPELTGPEPDSEPVTYTGPRISREARRRVLDAAAAADSEAEAEATPEVDPRLVRLGEIGAELTRGLRDKSAPNGSQPFRENAAKAYAEIKELYPDPAEAQAAYRTFMAGIRNGSTLDQTSDDEA